MQKILVVEDDTYINRMICETLTKDGYECSSAYSGTEALLRLSGQAFHLVILDLMLPGATGQEVLEKIRCQGELPVIILSAKDELDSKISLLTLGANDYMTKPFEIQELAARVQVQLRGTKALSGCPRLLCYRALQLDLEKMEFCAEMQCVPLTAHELKIMELLMRHPGRVFSKNEIYEYAWETCYLGEDKTINVHISNIRQKLKKVSAEEYIETVWGLGFKLK